MQSKREQERFAYDLSFQERVARVLVEDPDFCVTLAAPHLDPKLFENKVHRWVAETSINYAKKHQSGISVSALKIEADRAFVAGRLQRKRDRPAVRAIISKLRRRSVRDRSYIRDEIHRFIKQQTFKDAFLEGVDLIKRGKSQELDKQVQRVLDVQEAEQDGLGHFMVGDRVSRFKRRRDYVADGMPSGFEFDKYMKGGGLRRKQLGVFIAPPSGGKTNHLIQTMKQCVLLAQARVLYISFELAEEVIEDRTDASFTGIKIDDLEEGNNPKRVRKFWRKLMDSLPNKEAIVIKEFPAKTKRVSQLLHYVKRLERRGFYPDVIFVDYADLLIPEDGSKGSDYQDVGNIFVELRAMAQKLKIPIWTAGQGNRESVNKKVITMKELADSFKKAMHADVLVAICQTEQERLRNNGRHYLMKNRNGQANMEFPVRFDWERAKIINR